MSPTERQRQKRIDTAFGEWVRERLAAMKPDRWTQQRLAEEVSQRGVQVTREWVNQVINGEHAGDDLRDAIEMVLGRFTEPDSLEPTSAELAAAIRDHTAAVNALVQELRQGWDVRLSAVEAAVAFRASQRRWRIARARTSSGRRGIDLVMATVSHLPRKFTIRRRVPNPASPRSCDAISETGSGITRKTTRCL